jgi:hypothetical protein
MSFKKCLITALFLQLLFIETSIAGGFFQTVDGGETNRYYVTAVSLSSSADDTLDNGEPRVLVTAKKVSGHTASFLIPNSVFKKIGLDAGSFASLVLNKAIVTNMLCLRRTEINSNTFLCPALMISFQ